MLNRQEFEYQVPQLEDMLKMVDVIEDNPSQLRGLFEHTGNLILNRPHQLEAKFLNKVVDFLVSYHRAFRRVFEDEFLAKAVAKICYEIDDKAKKEILDNVIYPESHPDRVSYFELFNVTRLEPPNFLNSYKSFYKNLQENKSYDHNEMRDFRNFLQTIVVGISFINKVDNTKITTPVGLVIKDIKDRLNRQDSEDSILAEIYTSMTDPNLTTGKFETSDKVLDAMKDTPTDPIDASEMKEKIEETVADKFTTDPDLTGEAQQKMHLIISLEKLIANAREFLVSEWMRMSNEKIKVCHKNYEKTLKTLDVCWDWENWQLKEDFDIRNLPLVFQEATTSFNNCLRDIAIFNSKSSQEIERIKASQPRYIGVSMSTYEDMKAVEKEAARHGVELMEVDETLPVITSSYFTGRVVFIESGTPFEDPRSWTEFKNEDDEELQTADLDRAEFAKLLQRDMV